MSLPSIKVSENIEAMADAAIAALAGDDRDDADSIYQRGGRLVHLVRSEEPGEAAVLVIRNVAPATLAERLSAVATWYREVVDKNGSLKMRAVKPPKDVVAAVAERGHWPGIRQLVGLVDAPMLRADGSVLQTPGYDVASGYLYRPNADFPLVPEAPTRADAIAAATDLAEVIADFPFAKDADRSVWLAELLTVLARPAIKGNTPLFVVDASVRGAGKGKLVDTIGILATGRRVPTCTLPTSEEEIRKKLTSIISAGKLVVHFDNVTEPIGGENLESLATSPTWGDRQLGKNDASANIELPKRIVVFFTGNNLRYKGDTARRVVPLRLVPRDEHPEDRNDFRHADLLSWVSEHRPRLVTAALTILRGFHTALCPRTGAAYGSFEEWAALIVEAVRWIGWPDPMGTRTGIEEANDETKAALLYIVEQWQPSFGQRRTTAKQIAARLSQLSDLRVAFATVCGNDSLDSRRIGDALAKHKDRVISGRSIRKAGVLDGAAAWECNRVA